MAAVEEELQVDAEVEEPGSPSSPEEAEDANEGMEVTEPTQDDKPDVWSIEGERARVARRVDAKRKALADAKAAEEREKEKQDAALAVRRKEVEQERLRRKDQRRAAIAERVRQKEEKLKLLKEADQLSRGGKSRANPGSKNSGQGDSTEGAPVQIGEKSRNKAAEAYRRRPSRWPLPAKDRFADLAAMVALERLETPAGLSNEDEEKGTGLGEDRLGPHNAAKDLGDISRQVEDVAAIDNVYKRTTKLHEEAADVGATDTVRLERLLKAGAPLDAQDFAGDTPLHCAARAGHLNAIELLLEADQPLLRTLMIRNHKNRTPLEVAAVHFMKRIVSKDMTFQGKSLLKLLSSATMKRLEIEQTEDETKLSL